MSIDGIIKPPKKVIKKTTYSGLKNTSKPSSSHSSSLSDIKKATSNKKIIKKPTTTPLKKNPTPVTNTEKNHISQKENNKATIPDDPFDFNLSDNDLIDEPKKTKKQKKKKKHILRNVLLIILGFIIVGLIILFVWGNDIISKVTGGESNIFDVMTFVEEKYVDLDTDENGRTNVLIFGTSGYDMEGTEGDYAHDGAQLTDTIMVVSIDQKNGDVAMINLPRDLKVSGSCTATGKINEIYWCNNIDGENESEGAIALSETIKDILGLEIQYYTHVNWETLISVVDSLGGITVTLDEDIDDTLYTGISIKANTPTLLNGEEALGLARARHGTAQGDFSRGNSQQKILIALKERVIEKGLDIIEAINILNSLGDNVRTNASLEEIKSGIHILKDLDMNSMRQIPLLDWDNDIVYFGTDMINGISYVVPANNDINFVKIKEYVKTMLNPDPVIRENAFIEVLNATDTSGLASNEKQALMKEGFKNITIGDLSEEGIKDIHLYILNDRMIGTKEKLESYYKITCEPGTALPSEIQNNDSDFVIILGNKDNKDE